MLQAEASKQTAESEPTGGESTSTTSPQPQTKTYNQHVADYTCLFEAEGMPLYLGQGRAPPLIAEVSLFPYFSPHFIMLPLKHILFKTIFFPTGIPQDLPCTVCALAGRPAAC